MNSKVTSYHTIAEVMNREKTFSIPDLIGYIGGSNKNYQALKSFATLLLDKGYLIVESERVRANGKYTRLCKYYKVVKPVEPLRRNIISISCILTSNVKGVEGIVCSSNGKVTLSFNKEFASQNAKVFHSKYNAKSYISRVRSIIGKKYKFKIREHEHAHTEPKDYL